MRINDRRDCIGRIVKAVDKFEPQGDQQCHNEQNKGPPRVQVGARGAEVADQGIASISHASKEQREKDDYRAGFVFGRRQRVISSVGGRVGGGIRVQFPSD